MKYKINLTHSYHIFPWLCAWDVCYIIFWHLLHIHSGKNWDFVFIIIVQFMMSANSWIHFGLMIMFISLYIAPSHYHYCTVQTYLNTLNLWNAWQIYFVQCESMIKHVFSVIQYTIYGALCFQCTHFACDVWENIHFVLLSSSNRKYDLLSIV